MENRHKAASEKLSSRLVFSGLNSFTFSLCMLMIYCSPSPSAPGVSLWGKVADFTFKGSHWRLKPQVSIPALQELTVCFSLKLQGVLIRKRPVIPIIYITIILKLKESCVIFQPYLGCSFFNVDCLHVPSPCSPVHRAGCRGKVGSFGGLAVWDGVDDQSDQT